MLTNILAVKSDEPPLTWSVHGIFCQIQIQFYSSTIGTFRCFQHPLTGVAVFSDHLRSRAVFSYRRDLLWDRVRREEDTVDVLVTSPVPRDEIGVFDTTLRRPILPRFTVLRLSSSEFRIFGLTDVIAPRAMPFYTTWRNIFTSSVWI